MPQGNIADFLKTNFQSGIFGNLGTLGDVERSIESQLATMGVQGPLEQLGVRHDPFSLPLSAIPRSSTNPQISARDELAHRRNNVLGIERLLDDYGEVTTQGSGFRLMRDPRVADPATGELPSSGYGSFVFDRSAFIGASRDEAAVMLNASLSNVQVTRGLHGKLEYSPTGVAYTDRFLTGQAQHIVDMQQTGGNYLAGKKLFYFDTETTGVHPQSRVWQIAGQTVQDGAEVAGGGVDIHFRGVMDGMWAGESGPVSFEDFYQNLRKGQIEWTDDLTMGLKRFLDVANEADHIVAQNAQFDIRQMFKLIGDVYDGADDELRAAATQFVNKTMDPAAVIDTRALAAAFLGDTPVGADGKRLGVENLLSSTTAQADFFKKYGVKLTELLKDGGLHDAGVDTRVLRYLHELMIEAAQGGDVLRPLDQVDDDFARLVSHGSAQTPLTPMQGSGQTPIAYGIEQTRRLEGGAVRGATVDRIFEAMGRFGGWTDYMTSGSDLAQGRLMFDESFTAVQQAAMDANIPYAGLSGPERLLSTSLARAMPYNASMEGVAGSLRNVVGEITGGGLFRTAETARLYGENLAVPLAALKDQRVASLLGIDSNVLQQGAQTAEEMISARLSFYSYPVADGTGIRADTALVIDPFEAMDDARLRSSAGELVDILKSKYGLDNDMARTILDDPEVLRNRGIQIGNLGTGPDSELVHNLAQRLGLSVDDKSPHQARVALGNVVQGADGSYVSVSPTMVGEQGSGEFSGASRKTVFQQEQARKQLADLLDENRGDRWLARMFLYAQKTGNFDRAKSIYDGIGWLSSNNRVPKIAAGIAAAAITGRAAKNRLEMRQYDETIDFQGYESGGFYDEYRDEMGLHRLPAGYEGRHLDTLATAHTVGDLDRNKIQHTTMGASKYDHLFV